MSIVTSWASMIAEVNAMKSNLKNYCYLRILGIVAVVIVIVVVVVVVVALLLSE